MEPPRSRSRPLLSLSLRLAPLTLARLPPTPPSRPPSQTTVSKVIGYIQKKMLKKHPEMFLKGKEL